jgi:putative transposase
MAERGVAVTYETICEWCLKFSGTYAKRIRSHSSGPGDRWHLS